MGAPSGRALMVCAEQLAAETLALPAETGGKH